MSTAQHLMTAEELLATPNLGRCELIEGELTTMSPASGYHGKFGGRLHVFVGSFVHEHRLGEVFLAETGFIIGRDPDTVRRPDIAFVRADRAHLVLPSGFFPGPPDLAVEVVSPGDSRSEVEAKTQAWLNAGGQSVWILDPASETIVIHHREEPAKTFTAADSLTDDVVLPGFRLVLAELFE